MVYKRHCYMPFIVHMVFVRQTSADRIVNRSARIVQKERNKNRISRAVTVSHPSPARDSRVTRAYARIVSYDSLVSFR